MCALCSDRNDTRTLQLLNWKDMRKVREGLEPWARQWRARGAAEGDSAWRGGPGRRRPVTAGPPSPGHSALWPRPPWRPWHVTPLGGHVWLPTCATSHNVFIYHTVYSLITQRIQLPHCVYSYHIVHSVITQYIQLSHRVFSYHSVYSVITHCIQLAHSIFS